MKRFEYLIENQDYPNYEKGLDEAEYLSDKGTEGWELVIVLYWDHTHTYYFKRELAPYPNISPKEAPEEPFVKSIAITPGKYYMHESVLGVKTKVLALYENTFGAMFATVDILGKEKHRFDLKQADVKKFITNIDEA